MSRFKVNQTYYFIRNYITNAIGNTYWSTSLASNDTLHEIQIIKAVCESEHTVPVAYSEDRTTTGYLFNVDGAVYHNQYPVAYYGQMSDVADRTIHRLNESADELFDYLLLNSAIDELYNMQTRIGAHQQAFDFITSWLVTNNLDVTYIEVFPNSNLFRCNIQSKPIPIKTFPLKVELPLLGSSEREYTLKVLHTVLFHYISNVTGMFDAGTSNYTDAYNLVRDIIVYLKLNCALTLAEEEFLKNFV